MVEPWLDLSLQYPDSWSSRYGPGCLPYPETLCLQYLQLLQYLLGMLFSIRNGVWTTLCHLCKAVSAGGMGLPQSAALQSWARKSQPAAWSCRAPAAHHQLHLSLLPLPR